ncbi:MAG TPA: ATP-dependent DNA helicase UvrD2 [Actinomycetota bacterium]|nr:ATP-dependent DNA helicase UvrD2 [Actinomycetota bacterium]
MPIRCSHCGSTHPDAQSVRACWSSGQRGKAADATESGDDEWVAGLWDEPEPLELARLPRFAPSPVSADVVRPPVASPAAGAAALFLGRSVLVAPGANSPDAWSGCPRVVVEGDGNQALPLLEEAFYSRRPLVIEVEPGWEPPGPESETSPAWSLPPGFSFPGERLVHAVFSNSLDARRGGSNLWSWSSRAIASGASAASIGDVKLAGGTEAYVDGGPLAFPAADAAGRLPAVIPAVTVEHGRLDAFRTNRCDAALAPDQLEAVTHPGGSARILAPAGSGKTRVLTERARHLLTGWGIPPEALCLVAFNKRAAEEMRERTPDLPALQIRTLNSLGLAILSGSGQYGGARAVQTVDEPAVRRILEDLVSFPRRANTDPAAAWIEALSAVRLGLKAPEQVEAEFQGDVDGLATVFPQYRDALEQRGVVDFDEQIYRALEVLLADPDARARVRPRCRVLLVDEFQDLTPAHLLLLRLLAGPSGSVFGVGDDDQTIYGYAGASPAWLIDYESYFPASGTHLLEVNYRCPPAVTKAARTLLTHNRVRVNKPIRSAGAPSGASDGGLAVTVSEDPVRQTADVVRWQLGRGVAADAIAVLSRVNSSLAPVQLSLQEARIPVNRAVDARFLERTGVRAALGWLRLAANPRSLRAVDVTFTARRPPRALSPKVIEWMSEQRSLERLRSLAERVGERDRDKVNKYADDVERMAALAERAGTDELLRYLRDDIGLAASISVLDYEHRRLDRSPQTDDLDALIALGSLHPDPGTFDDWLRKGLSAPGHPGGVTLATVHSVKGREWDAVVVHNVTSGLMPHRLAFDVEEERRVFHVAITRTRRSCTVVAGMPASPFLEELETEWQPGSGEVLAQRKPAGPAAAAQSPAPRAAPEERVMQALKAWRLETARREGRPAYTVFHDSTLEAIAASGARSLQDLAGIKGVGPAKLESFGDEILAVLDAAAESAP